MMLRLLLVILALIGLAPLASANVTLPFSGTYNCVEQQQADGTWVTCDGLNSYGGWTTVAGSKEQITSAANYAGGGGGRGQRHWVGDGHNDLSGGVFYGFNGGPHNELYIRWYARYQSGLDLTSNVFPFKAIYFLDCAGNVSGCYVGFGPTETRVTVAGNNYTVTTWGAHDVWGAATSDGNWHCYEVHVKKISTGSADGTFEMWFDGTKRVTLTNVNWGGDMTTGFSGMRFPENGDFTTAGGVDNYYDIDDVAIQTTGPIGVLGGGASGAGGGMEVGTRHNGKGHGQPFRMVSHGSK